MTKSPQAKTIRPPKPRPPISVILLSILFRLLLLGVGSSFAWIIGMAIAQVYPSSRSQAPLVETLLFRTSEPQSSQTSTPALNPTPLSPSPTTPQVQLTSGERQQLQTQLQELQQQLNTLIGRTAALETQLGISRPSETLEKRLQIVDRQLSLSDQTVPNAATPTPTRTTTSTQAQTRFRASQGLVVTLPSDVLFATNTNSLRPGASVILDTLIADLENYKGASVRVAAHTDDTGKAQDNLSLSLQQAEAIVAYLSTAIGSEYHWVAIGYGEGQPTVENDSTTNKQLNRRIEVAIAP
ncbi:OmpA family protein [Lyngbya sp. PCC 8106]|uniref:OmpA family protein n=1 Tax=Lyngbya sp. (strain PCC 8106) TaxID=313612 RepID=UPI0000EAB1EB|nr:OmpA family protein [Lyngbya sp. PCC 8106]EAW39307.1 outer membrane protein F [Lyngbya sp. PCC 8106]